MIVRREDLSTRFQDAEITLTLCGDAEQAQALWDALRDTEWEPMIGARGRIVLKPVKEASR